MTTAPVPVRRAHTIVLVQAAACGSVAAVILALTVATYTQRTAPDGKTAGDVAGPLALQAGGLVLALVIALLSRRLRTGSDVARWILIVLESAVAITGLVLGAVAGRHGLSGAAAIWLVVFVPAALAAVSLCGPSTRNWCRTRPLA